MTQFLRVETHGNLFVLLAEHLHRAHTLDGAQPVFQVIHIFAKFPVSLVVALHGYQQCRGVTEITQRLHTQHPRRKFGLDPLHPYLEFIPERIGILNVIVKLHEHDERTRRNLAVGLSLVDLLI